MKIIDWFNDQYAGVIHAEPAIFIEFPDALEFETLRQDVQQAEFTIRIHLASKAIQKQDRTISEDVIETHFNICDKIYYKLQGYRLQEGDMLIFNSLARTNYEHHQYMQGWMVTTQDFEGVIYQDERQQQTVKQPEFKIRT